MTDPRNLNVCSMCQSWVFDSRRAREHHAKKCKPLREALTKTTGGRERNPQARESEMPSPSERGQVSTGSGD